MIHTGPPTWVWGFIAVTIVPCCIALAFIFAAELFGPKPARRIKRGDTTIELWVRERKYPSSAEAIIVPVAPDMKMNFGIAKWVKDRTANRLQRQAEMAAPLEPGEVFIGPGGKFKFNLAALVVVMDDAKRSQPEWITKGISRAILLAREHDARSIIIPDMTEDLLRQPNEISDKQRNETARPIARAIMQAVLDAPQDVEEIKIWCWREVNRSIYLEELERIAPESSVKAVPASA